MKWKWKVAQSCATLCDNTAHGQHRPEHWSGELFPSPGDLSNPGIKQRFPTLQVDSLPAKPQGKSKNTLKWVAYPFSSGSSRPRNQTGVSCIAGGFFTNWAIREAQLIQRAIKCSSIWSQNTKKVLIPFKLIQIQCNPNKNCNSFSFFASWI